MDVPSTARDTAAPGPDHDLVLIGAGDGHRFGYARGITAAPVERPSPERTALTTGTASGPRASGRATGWSWRPGESTGEGGVSHRSSGDDALAIARAATAPALEVGDDGRSLRITQTFAYLHGATGSASTTETPTGGFEVPTGTEPETDLGEGQDTGTALDPVRRRATGGGGGRGHGEAPRGGSGRNPPSRAGTR